MGKKRGGGGGGTNDDATATTKHEQPLQAVLLADAFTNKSFMPASLDRPPVLFPFNNVPLIEYAVDFLAGAGVEELYVVCTSDEVDDFFRETKNASWSNLAITVVKDTSLTNAGDALREIDKRNVIASDPFILMFGDTVTNADLSEPIRAHAERHKKDSSAIMTLLFKPVGAASSSSCSCDDVMYPSIRSNADDLIVGFDPTHDNRILLYDDRSNESSVSVPCSFLVSHPQIDLRSDLLDCGIDLCSPDVLARVADEFDYRDLRKEFVTNSVAEEEEGLQNRLYGHILKPTEYAARAHDWYTYHNISNDMLRRWCYPVVPDHLPRGPYSYAMQRHYLYYERFGKMRVGRSSKISGVGMIGSNCVIGEECCIQGSVIGNDVRIADDVTIKNSHVWDKVVMGQGASVTDSILGDGCTVKAGATVNRGCVIGAGCVVGEGIVLPEYTRITLKEETDDDFDDDWSDEDEDGDDEESKEEKGQIEKCSSPSPRGVDSDVNVVGLDGKGRKWEPSPDDDYDDDEEEEGVCSAERLAKTMQSQSIGYNPSDYYKDRFKLQKEGEDDLSEDEDETGDLDEYYADGPVTFEAEPEPITRPVPWKGVDVIKELKMICLESEPNSPIENLAIELNSFKFSQNASYSDCTMAATLAILEKLDIRPGMSDGKLVADFKSSLEYWAPLLRKMSMGLDEEKAIVLALERCATQDDDAGKYLSSGMSFRFLLQTLHDEEIVSEDAVLSWANERREETDKDSAAYKLFQMQPVQDFLEWLAEESEEGDSDDDDSDEEE